VRFKCRGLYGERTEGFALVSRKPISFLGDVDSSTGVVIDENSDILGEKITGKILVFPFTRGSTVGPYVLLRLKKRGTAPLAIVNEKGDPIVVAGAVIAEIPFVDRVEEEFFKIVKSGVRLIVDPKLGFVELVE